LTNRIPYSQRHRRLPPVVAANSLSTSNLGASSVTPPHLSLSPSSVFVVILFRDFKAGARMDTPFKMAWHFSLEAFPVSAFWVVSGLSSCFPIVIWSRSILPVLLGNKRDLTSGDRCI